MKAIVPEENPDAEGRCIFIVFCSFLMQFAEPGVSPVRFPLHKITTIYKPVQIKLIELLLL